MAELLIGRDIEGMFIDHYLVPALAAQGVTIPVAGKPRGVESISVVATGGPGIDRHVIDRAQLTFDVRRHYEDDASTTAQILRAVMRAAAGTVIDGTMVYRVDELARPANLPDPNYDGARFRWSTFVHVRLAVR